MSVECLFSRPPVPGLELGHDLGNFAAASWVGCSGAGAGEGSGGGRGARRGRRSGRLATFSGGGGGGGSGGVSGIGGGGGVSGGNLKDAAAAVRLGPGAYTRPLFSST